MLVQRVSENRSVLWSALKDFKKHLHKQICFLQTALLIDTPRHHFKSYDRSVDRQEASTAAKEVLETDKLQSWERERLNKKKLKNLSDRGVNSPSTTVSVTRACRSKPRATDGVKNTARHCWFLQPAGLSNQNMSSCSSIFELGY